MAMLEKEEDGVVTFGALLTDLSKIFDFFDHERIIVWMYNSYGFSFLNLKLIHDKLSYRKQRAKINDSYNDWLAPMVHQILQGSILGLLLFNIFLADSFFFRIPRASFIVFVQMVRA